MTFEDVAAAAGVLDHGAGMSATFLDYDNDGRLDIYTGNMWSAPGQRVTSAPAFMPDATPDVRALYRRHVRGNSLLRNLGDGRFEDRTIEAHAEMGRWAWSSDALDFDSDGWDDLYVVNGMLTRESANGRRRRSRPVPDDLEGFFWRQVVAHSPLTRVPGTPYDDAWRAINQLLIHGSIASRQRNVFLRNDGHGGFDEVVGRARARPRSGRPIVRAARPRSRRRPGPRRHGGAAGAAAPHLPERFRVTAVVARSAVRGSPARRAIAMRSARASSCETDRMRRTKIVQAGSGFLSQHSKELVVGLGRERARREPDRRLAIGTERRSSPTCR